MTERKHSREERMAQGGPPDEGGEKMEQLGGQGMQKGGMRQKRVEFIDEEVEENQRQYPSKVYY